MLYVNTRTSSSKWHLSECPLQLHFSHLKGSKGLFGRHLIRKKNYEEYKSILATFARIFCRVFDIFYAWICPHTVSVHILQRICRNWVQQCYVDIDIAKDQDLQPMEGKRKRDHYIHIYHQHWFLWWNSSTERKKWCYLKYLVVKIFKLNA